MAKQVDKDALKEAGMAWLKLQYATSQKQFDKLFSEMSSADYITLTTLSKQLGLSDSRVYLKEISEILKMPMNQVSRRVTKLQDRGLVYWKHDEAGTYIKISEIGLQTMEKQQQKLMLFIEKTIERYGFDQFMQLLEYRKTLNLVMDQVVEEL